MRDIDSKIRKFLYENIDENELSTQLRPDESLIDAGFLDSLNFIKLLAFLDEKFGIVPNENELSPQNFDSINLIIKFIQNKLIEFNK